MENSPPDHDVRFYLGDKVNISACGTTVIEKTGAKHVFQRPLAALVGDATLPASVHSLLDHVRRCIAGCAALEQQLLQGAGIFPLVVGMRPRRELPVVSSQSRQVGLSFGDDKMDKSTSNWTSIQSIHCVRACVIIMQLQSHWTAARPE